MQGLGISGARGAAVGMGICLFTAALTGAACSAGGGGESTPPSVVFSFSTSDGTAHEGGAALEIEVVLGTTLASLGEAVTLEVVDLEDGTATAAQDYATFGSQVLTFPANSVDGDARSVSVTALGDGRVEGASETIHLRLVNQSAGAIGAAGTFVATLLDEDQATIQFASGQSATTGESAGDHTLAVELALDPGDVLAVDAEVRVSDSGSGSAASGLDYATFAPRTVTFPAGSLDGATESVTLTVVDDPDPEGDETAVLVLDTPSAGTRVGALAAHAVTIPDDDGGGAQAFYASEGGTGVENPLDHDELIDLGSQTVGGGPNAGTLLRVSNLGGDPLVLGPPILGGSHGEDFVVELELAALPQGSLAPGATSEPHDMLAPLAGEAKAEEPGIALTLDALRLEELEAVSHARLHGFPVPGLGQVTLELERRTLPIAPGALFVVDGQAVAGGLQGALEGLSIWSGRALEVEGSRAFVSFSDDGPRGFLELPLGRDRIVHLYTERPATAGAPMVCRVVHDEDLLAMGAEAPSSLCGGERSIPGAAADSIGLDSLALGSGPPTQGLSVPNCTLAIETDYQLYQKLGSVPATTTYVTQLIAAVSDQYLTDVQCILSIAYLGVYSSAADPWTSQDGGGDAGDLLDEFRAAWGTSWPASANLAHFISGANLGGGVAYVNALCSASFGFGVSGNINGNVNWGIWSGAPASFTWDFVVVAHELGHNFGTSHTHSYCPPLDQCWINCDGPQSCAQGTIMSYCHTCGGMDNIDLNFHPVVANVLRQRVASSCLGNSSLGAAEYLEYRVRFSPTSVGGPRSAELEFTHDAGNQPQPFRIRLQGTGN